MQEGATDYYHLPDIEGCCLKCSDAREGCLCFKCRCKKCYWYSPPEDYGINGSCDIKEKAKEERRKSVIEYYKNKEKEESQKSEELEKENAQILNKLKRINVVPNYYTCQRCSRLFVSEDSYEIKVNKYPVCNICTGKLKLKCGVKDGNPNT